MPQSAPSPLLEILQVVAVTTKECSRGGRLRPRSLDPLATARELQVLKQNLPRGLRVWDCRWDRGAGVAAAVPFLLCFSAERDGAVRNAA